MGNYWLDRNKPRRYADIGFNIELTVEGLRKFEKAFGVKRCEATLQNPPIIILDGDAKVTMLSPEDARALEVGEMPINDVREQYGFDGIE